MESNEYDGSKCPNCLSEDITGDEIEPIGANSAFRNCSCDSCGAIWTEELKVVGFDNLELAKPS